MFLTINSMKRKRFFTRTLAIRFYLDSRAEITAEKKNETLFDFLFTITNTQLSEKYARSLCTPLYDIIFLFLIFNAGPYRTSLPNCPCVRS